MKLILILYVLLWVEIWSATNKFREKPERNSGLLEYGLTMIVWTVITIAVEHFFGFNAEGFLFHIVFSLTACAGGVGLSHLYHRKKTIKKSNEFGGITYRDDFRFRDGTRSRTVYHLDRHGNWKKTERYSYFKGKWSINDITLYYKEGYCLSELYDNSGRIVIEEEIELVSSKRISIKFPQGKEAAQLILDRRLP